MTNCPVFKTNNLIGKKWTFFIIQELSKKESEGFNELCKRLKSVRPKILSKRLKELEINGIIQKQKTTNPLKTNYSLTQKGKDFNLAIKNIIAWNVKYSGEDLMCGKINCVDCGLF